MRRPRKNGRKDERRWKQERKKRRMKTWKKHGVKT